jgi:hypothetical protein
VKHQPINLVDRFLFAFSGFEEVAVESVGNGFDKA